MSPTSCKCATRTVKKSRPESPQTVKSGRGKDSCIVLTRANLLSNTLHNPPAFPRRARHLRDYSECAMAHTLGIAQLHLAGREQKLLCQPWIGHTVSRTRLNLLVESTTLRPLGWCRPGSRAQTCRLAMRRGSQSEQTNSKNANT